MILTPEMKARRPQEIWEDLNDYEEINTKSLIVTGLTTLALFVGAGVLVLIVMVFDV